MFANYVTTALRNLFKNKLYSFINIVGLAVGLAACILILLFVRDQLSYDRHVPGTEDIHKIQMELSPPGRDTIYWATGPGRAYDELEALVPEITDVARIFYRQTTVQRDANIFSENLMYASPNFFEFFGVPFVAGDAARALQDTRSVVISQSMARKYLGRADGAVGQTLTIATTRGDEDFVVTGVVEDWPVTSHMVFDLAIMINPPDFADQPNLLQRWMAGNTHLYIKLEPGADPTVLAPQFFDIIDRQATPEVLEFQMPVESATEIATLVTVALRDVHLEGFSRFSIKPKGSLGIVITFTAVAVLILLIAVINFTNLSSARALHRAREVGMRKVLGASRRQLISQILGESVIFAGLAMLLAMALSELILPFYNRFLGTEMALNYASDPAVGLTFIGLAVIAGLMGGLYPAAYLSKFRPAEVLKSGKSEAGPSPRLRTVLVILQFAISIALISATAIVYNQMQFARNFDPGFEKENVVVLGGINRAEVFPLRHTLREELLSHAAIESATLSSLTPGFPIGNGTRAFVPDNPEPIVLMMRPIDFGFFDTYGIEPIAGRSLSRDFGTDIIRDRNSRAVNDGSVVINSIAAVRMGLGTPQEAIGKSFRFLADSNDTSAEVTATVVGVLPDINFSSIRDTVSPEIFFVDEQTQNFLSLKYRSDDTGAVLGFIDQTWRGLVPDAPVTRFFLDDNIAAQYQTEETSGRIFAVFALLAILVSSLGLYGLASFIAERRTREIGIRKVLGASVRNIVQLMVWQFSKPVLIANLIAWPVAFYFMNEWLSGFVHRISLSPLVFILAGLAALLIAWTTVAGHAVRVARTNPAIALRYE